MNHATAYSDLFHPEAYAVDWNQAQIETVARRIRDHLLSNPEERLSALKEAMDNVDLPGLGMAMFTGDFAEAGRIADKAARDQIEDDAKELAESWLNDDLTSWDLLRLAEWRPIKYACLSKRYHLADMGV